MSFSKQIIAKSLCQKQCADFPRDIDCVNTDSTENDDDEKHDDGTLRPLPMNNKHRHSRLPSPSSKPKNICVLEKGLNESTMTFRLYYSSHCYFKGRRNSNDQYRISIIMGINGNSRTRRHILYGDILREYGVRPKEWVIVDVNGQRLEIKNKATFEGVKRALNWCNKEYCYPFRSTGYTITIRRDESFQQNGDQHRHQIKVKSVNIHSDQRRESLKKSENQITVRLHKDIGHYMEIEREPQNGNGMESINEIVVKDVMKENVPESLYGLEPEEWILIDIDGDDKMMKNAVHHIEDRVRAKVAVKGEYTVTLRKRMPELQRLKAINEEMNDRVAISRLEQIWKVDEGKVDESSTELLRLKEEEMRKLREVDVQIMAAYGGIKWEQPPSLLAKLEILLALYEKHLHLMQ